MARDEFEDQMSKMRFDTENVLNLFAEANIILDAQQLYDDEFHKQYAAAAEDHHIYMIGFTPLIKFEGATQQDDVGFFKYTIDDVVYELPIELPAGAFVKNDNGTYILLPDGRKVFPSSKTIEMALSARYGGLDFHVLYVGQSYGKDGSRNALVRLEKHETLQKIAINGIPEGKRLSILLVKIMQGTRVITYFNPFAKEKDVNGDRLDMGFDKLYGTNEAERTTLYEASFIRYFQPKYNKIFRDSFPSTNMKTLADCYEKDIQSIAAEFNFDDFGFHLCSEAVPKSQYHVASHNLHAAEDRKFFFFGQK